MQASKWVDVDLPPYLMLFPGWGFWRLSIQLPAANSWLRLDCDRSF